MDRQVSENRILSNNLFGDHARIQQGNNYYYHGNSLNFPIAKDAAFNSHAEEYETRCQFGTRVRLLSQVEAWAADPHSETIFWLNGMAGTGKSTISRTMAHYFEEQGRLAGSFFFKRSELNRAGARLFFTTIASQLASRVPAVSDHIQHAFRRDPSIDGAAFKVQFETLILQPLRDARFDTPLVIVIDALDECQEDQDIKAIISVLLRANETYTHLKTFMTSRPERSIRLEFEKAQGQYRSLALHDIPKTDIEDDLRNFLNAELDRIKKTYNRQTYNDSRLPDDWPSKENIESLLQMATPLFIFAATICRFVDTKGSNPAKQLKNALENRKTHDGSKIDQLSMTYLPILNQLIVGKIDEQIHLSIEAFREVVGPILALVQPLSAASLAKLLQIEVGDIHLRLELLHSVLRVPSDQHAPIRLFHLSFRDFLTDKESAGRFWIDEMYYHSTLADKCIELMEVYLKRDICGLNWPGRLQLHIDQQIIDAKLPPDLQYACLYWAYHINRSKCHRNETLLQKADAFFQKHFLHWLEVLSLLGQVDAGIRALQHLEQTLKTHEEHDEIALGYFKESVRRFREPQRSEQEIGRRRKAHSANNTPWIARLRDALRTLHQSRHAIIEAPLQVYSSLLIFAPEDGFVRETFGHEIPCWVSILPRLSKGWSSVLQTFEGHTSSVDSVAFSPDGRQLASASRYDGMVRLWDVATGETLQTLKNHFSQVVFVAFSPDCRKVVFVSQMFRKVLVLWEVATGEDLEMFSLPESVTTGPNSPLVTSVIFSPCGLRLASASEDGKLHLLNIVTGEVLQTSKAHTSRVHSVAYSLDGRRLASSSKDDGIWLWDAMTGEALQSLGSGTSRPHHSLAFSPNGRQLASLMSPDSIILWNLVTGEVQQEVSFMNFEFGPISITFSPDSLQLVSGSADGTIRLWNTATCELLQILKGHGGAVTSVAFSLDGRQLASGSGDKTIRLWDTAKREKIRRRDFKTDHQLYRPRRLVPKAYHRVVNLYRRVSIFPRLAPLLPAVYQRRKDHANSVDSVAFSPDGQQLASSDRATILLRDTETGKVLLTLKGKKNWHDRVGFTPAIFSHDGRHLASTAVGKVYLWDIASGGALHTLGNVVTRFSSIVFSPSGLQLAVGSSDGTVQLWDTLTHKVVQTFQSHSESVTSASFSPSGRQLAVGSSDGTVQLWDTLTHKVVQEFEGHTEEVNSIAFSSDGQLLATKSRFARVRLWETATGVLQQAWDDRSIFRSLRPLFDRQNPSNDRRLSLTEDNSWINWNGHNLIWLPPGFRPSCATAQGDRIAIGCPSGIAYILGVDKEALPPYER